MNIVHLQYFVETVRAGSRKAAAEKLFVMPQTISKGITTLEKEFGVKLIETNDGISLTDSGKSFFEKASELVIGYVALSNTLKEVGSAENGMGRIAVALTSSPLEGITVPQTLFDSYRKMHSEVELSIMTSSNDVCLNALEENFVDAAILAGCAPNHKMKCTPLFSQELHVVLSISHPFANYHAISLSDLAGQKIISPNDTRFFQRVILERFMRKQIPVNFIDVAPLAEERVEFLEKEGGILFAHNKYLPREFYPQTISIPLAKEDCIKLPFYFVRQKEQASELVKKLELALWKTSDLSTKAH